MALVTSGDAEVFETHGVRFSSFVRPSRGSDQLCAWRVDVPAGPGGSCEPPASATGGSPLPSSPVASPGVLSPADASPSSRESIGPVSRRKVRRGRVRSRTATSS